MKFIFSFLLIIGMIIGFGLGVPDTLNYTPPDEVTLSEFEQVSDVAIEFRVVNDVGKEVNESMYLYNHYSNKKNIISLVNDVGKTMSANYINVNNSLHEIATIQHDFIPQAILHIDPGQVKKLA